MTKKKEDNSNLIALNAEKNKDNKIHILHIRLRPVIYFESENIEINLFQDTTNSQFKSICKKELQLIKKAELNGNKIVYNPYESLDIMKFRIPEFTDNDFKILFDDKFKDAENQGFLTEQYFAKNELNKIELRYKECFDWFPIFEQWKEFLNKIKLREIINSNENNVSLEEPKDKKKRADTITREDIAIFCVVLQDSKIHQNQNLNNVLYCKSVCEKFKLKYTTKISKLFGVNARPTSAQLTKMKNTVLPLIDVKVQKTITNYLDSKK